MGRTHDWHCPDCHCWVNGFELPPGEIHCVRRMFYDLNFDGCDTQECRDALGGTDNESAETPTTCELRDLTCPPQTAVSQVIVYTPPLCVGTTRYSL